MENRNQTNGKGNPFGVTENKFWNFNSRNRNKAAGTFAIRSDQQPGKLVGRQGNACGV